MSNIEISTQPSDLETTITVYTKPACVQCRQTKKALDRKGVQYNTVDVSEDAQALEYVKSLGFMSAPVVVTTDDSWAGYRPERIDAL